MQNDTRLGIWLMVATTLIFAAQDGLSRYLAGQYNVYVVVMIRYWFFAAFVIAISARKRGGLAQVIRTRQPVLQTIRGALLAAEICVMVTGFTVLGLVESHAVFACYPLLVAALSGPVLGERVGWRRWTAIAVGFIGVLVILEPGVKVFAPAAIIPLVSAFMFALYGLLTRYVARQDSAATSFFWTGGTGAMGHFTLIKCYEVAEASAVQPFAYLQLVFASAIGLTIFGEVMELNVMIGAAIVVMAGLFTLWRERQKT